MSQSCWSNETGGGAEIGRRDRSEAERYALLPTYLDGNNRENVTSRTDLSGPMVRLAVSLSPTLYSEVVETWFLVDRSR